MRVDEFDFVLPEEQIALRPVSPRHSAKLLLCQQEQIHDHHVSDLPNLLRPGDALVFNDTKVVPAQLTGYRYRQAYQTAISATLHQQIDEYSWQAFVKPGKRIKPGDQLVFHAQDRSGLTLEAQVTDKDDDGLVTLHFDQSKDPLMQKIATVGSMPLPPYIASKRPTDSKDVSDYQTQYASNEGAVAAPTAGLHFTDHLMTALDEAQISRHFVTLHVGAGTFLPVKVDDTDDHVMHSETGYVSTTTANDLNQVRERGGRIVAVGTTSLRLLESATANNGNLASWQGSTDIFITPGYQFRAVDGLMTNFHLPRSTLFMLVCALAGIENMKTVYQHAIDHGYRFYSYGDASLLWRKELV